MSEIDSRFGKPISTSSPQAELSQASDEVFNEWTKGIRGVCSSAFSTIEKVHDGSAAFFAVFFGQEAAAHHTREVEQDALSALEEGHLEAARHFIKRDIGFTMGTQGYDNENSQRLLKELEQLNNSTRAACFNQALK